jgi:hypothetical protein
VLTQIYISVSISLTGRSLPHTGSYGASSSPGDLQALLDGSDIDHALIPGTYSSGGTAIMNGNLYLLSDGTVNEWVFNVAGVLATAASSKMYFVDGTGATPVVIAATDALATSLAARVTWTVDAAIDIGADSGMIGLMISSMGAIVSGANAKTGDLRALNGAINLGADSNSGDLLSGAAITLGAGASAGKIHASAVGAVTLGANANVNGYITAADGAVALGTDAAVTGQIKASAAIVLGANAASCGICAGGAITKGAGASVLGSSVTCPSAHVPTGSAACLSACTNTEGAFLCGHNN